MRRIRLSAAVFVASLTVGTILVLPRVASAQTVPSTTGSKLGPLARERAASGVGRSRVIVRSADRGSMPLADAAVQQAGGSLGRLLPIINGRVADVPNGALEGLANHPFIERISLDRRIGGVLERTGATIFATQVRQQLGYDGAGVGVAIIDSGVTPWHDDLTGGGAQRVHRFVDFVNGRDTAYDDYGHGTHVAGIIAGNGFDSGGARSGIAPAAHLLVLKTLDANGVGHISDVIAALDYVVGNKDTLNIRVVNMSLAAGVTESYTSDPLTLAAKRAVEAGIVVVAAAGNLGRSALDRTQYRGVTAPGNAPWVVTVGASSHMGTTARKDDTLAAFSSRGPTAVDYAAKPDVVAPGVGLESLSDASSAFYTTKSAFLLAGTMPTPYLPYLSLTGTSMAAPVVTGTIALMLQANPALTPNAVKAILQYTAEIYKGYDALTQGAGFVNAKGAVDLARFFGGSPSARPSSAGWSKQIVWANHRLRGGWLTAAANAWSTDVTWGAALTPRGENVEWGVMESDGSVKRWGSTCADPVCSTFVWGDDTAPNVVWGVRCGGSDCQEAWTVSSVGRSLLGTTVVWGTGEADTVVWGTGDTVVWGTDTVVWGTNDEDQTVWGGSEPPADADTTNEADTSGGLLLAP